MSTLAIALTCALAALILRRLILIGLQWLIGIIGVLFGLRVLITIDTRLAQPEWMSGALVGGFAGFVVVGVLSYAIIYHMLIAADERRAIDKAHDDAKRRRLW